MRDPTDVAYEAEVVAQMRSTEKAMTRKRAKPDDDALVEAWLTEVDKLTALLKRTH